jgi:hypothetical protein
MNRVLPGKIRPTEPAEAVTPIASAYQRNGSIGGLMVAAAISFASAPASAAHWGGGRWHGGGWHHGGWGWVAGAVGVGLGLARGARPLPTPVTDTPVIGRLSIFVRG